MIRVYSIVTCNPLVTNNFIENTNNIIKNNSSIYINSNQMDKCACILLRSSCGLERLENSSVGLRLDAFVEFSNN